MVEHKQRGWVDAFTWRFSRIAMVLPGLIVIIMMYEVFMRYVLELPTNWVNEMSLWMGGWVYLLAGIYAMQQRSHIRITMLYDVVPRWLRKFFDVLSTVLIILWVAATIWGGFNEAWEALITWEKFDSAWAPPIPAITQPLVLLITLIVGIQAVSNLIMDWNEEGDGMEVDEMQAEIEELKRAQGLLDEDLRVDDVLENKNKG
jgi:TRAP-type C4-dicarboxylate transport system permease small subunit